LTGRGSRSLRRRARESRHRRRSLHPYANNAGTARVADRRVDVIAVFAGPAVGRSDLENS